MAKLMGWLQVRVSAAEKLVLRKRLKEYGLKTYSDYVRAAIERGLK